MYGNAQKTTSLQAEQWLNRWIRLSFIYYVYYMDYKIKEIGASFSDKWIKQLEQVLNTSSDDGYEFHSVIQIEKPGCLWAGKGQITYLAVFAKK